MPAWMNKSLFKSFYELGKTFGETGEFDKQIVLKLAKPERISKIQFWFTKLIGKNAFWNPMLKKNNAFEKRFARPYAK